MLDFRRDHLEVNNERVKQLCVIGMAAERFCDIASGTTRRKAFQEFGAAVTTQDSKVVIPAHLVAALLPWLVALLGL